MLGIFLRAVIFGVGVELGREIYKTVKNRAKDRLEPRGEEPAPAVDDTTDDEPAAPEPEETTEAEPDEAEPETPDAVEAPDEEDDDAAEAEPDAEERSDD